jgi:TRAP-type C4-dicarboxylate transport system permease small subunit
LAKAGSLVVAALAVALGLFLGYVGVTQMIAAGSFASGSSETHSGFLGLGGGSSTSSSVNTGAWVGLVVALVGAAALLFGLRALFVAFEGRGEA